MNPGFPFKTKVKELDVKSLALALTNLSEVNYAESQGIVNIPLI